MKEARDILRTLAKGSFRANRARNRIAVFAIVLTTVMFTTLFVLSFGMAENLRSMNFQQAGYDSHLSSGLLTHEEAEALLGQEAVMEGSRSLVLGVAENEELAGRQVELRFGEDAYARSAFSYPTEGAMPQQAEEIALDTLTLKKLGLPCKLGEEITLRWRKDLNGERYEESHFVLCGYWEGNEAAMASMAWVSEAFAREQCAGVDPRTQIDSGQVLGGEMLHLNLKGTGDLKQEAEALAAAAGLPEGILSPNMAYDSSMNQNILRELIPMGICMLLVFVSGYLIIYNIFQISVASDLRFYGRLKTLGATKKQIRVLIKKQAGRLSLVGIPIGLALGYLLGVVFVPLVLAGAREARASANPWIFLGSALFAWLTVEISCRKPAKMAGKVSPIEALRYTDGESAGRRKRKRSGKGGVIPRMALANLGRNRKRTGLVVGSLTLGLVLLSVIYAKNASFDLEKYMSQMVISDFEVEDSSISTVFTYYDPYGTTISPALEERIEGLSGLEKTGHLYSQVMLHEIGPSALANIQTYYQTDDRLAYIEATDPGLYGAYQEMLESGECTALIYGVDGLIADTFGEERRLVEGNFDLQQFLSGGYVLVEASASAEAGDRETQPTYSVGDEVELNGRSYQVMAIVTDISALTEGKNSETADFLSFYLPAADFKAMYPENTLRKLFFDVSEETEGEAEEMLTAYREQEDKSLTYTSKSTLKEHYKEQTRANTVMGYAIAVIIALVGILNFINSMATAIVSRRKEFAMIQSVGMTKRQLRSMLSIEGLLYAAATLLLSYGLGAAAVGVGVRAMVAGSWNATFHFTLLPLGICTPVLLALALLIPGICFRNLERESVVERLREAE